MNNNESETNIINVLQTQANLLKENTLKQMKQRNQLEQILKKRYQQFHRSKEEMEFQQKQLQKIRSTKKQLSELFALITEISPSFASTVISSNDPNDRVQKQRTENEGNETIKKEKKQSEQQQKALKEKMMQLEELKKNYQKQIYEKQKLLLQKQKENKMKQKKTKELDTKSSKLDDELKEQFTVRRNVKIQKEYLQTELNELKKLNDKLPLTIQEKKEQIKKLKRENRNKVNKLNSLAQILMYRTQLLNSYKIQSNRFPVQWISKNGKGKQTISAFIRFKETENGILFLIISAQNKKKKKNNKKSILVKRYLQDILDIGSQQNEKKVIEICFQDKAIIRFVSEEPAHMIKTIQELMSIDSNQLISKKN
ncbi:structural maintenance of chromosomes protein [Anaeramoeba flamelloides]|uniref:Structural maintenance of chromosomes protein n=1 Tax=Anaeramoeba flamelloides TaxID=1746091 RepID=A0AAV7Z5Y8_9EUKA|nr:structural maintenance of chromosomes protein [Anaeramoeba flamelloides]